MVSHSERLGVALAFVVAGTDPDRVYVPPVRLHLRMLQRITVDLRGGSEQEASTVAPGDLEHVARACGTGFEGLDRVRQIILRARERRKEIGRASCREKGEVSVVAGSLKKKKKHSR